MCDPRPYPQNHNFFMKNFLIFMMQNSKIKTTELERKVNELGKENDDLRNENNILKGTLSSVMKK